MATHNRDPQWRPTFIRSIARDRELVEHRAVFVDEARTQRRGAGIEHHRALQRQPVRTATRRLAADSARATDILLAHVAGCFYLGVLCFLQGRGYVIPQDIKSIGLDVLRHRILLSYEAEAEELNADDIILKIFENVEVP